MIPIISALGLANERFICGAVPDISVSAESAAVHAIS